MQQIGKNNLLICNKFAASLIQQDIDLHDKLAASLGYGDFGACVNLLQSWNELTDLSCWTCGKFAGLQIKTAANLLQVKIAIWERTSYWLVLSMVLSRVIDTLHKSYDVNYSSNLEQLWHVASDRVSSNIWRFYFN